MGVQSPPSRKISNDFFKCAWQGACTTYPAKREGSRVKKIDYYASQTPWKMPKWLGATLGGIFGVIAIGSGLLIIQLTRANTPAPIAAVAAAPIAAPAAVAAPVAQPAAPVAVAAQTTPSADDSAQPADSKHHSKKHASKSKKARRPSSRRPRRRRRSPPHSAGRSWPSTTRRTSGTRRTRSTSCSACKPPLGAVFIAPGALSEPAFDARSFRDERAFTFPARPL